MDSKIQADWEYAVSTIFLSKVVLIAGVFRLTNDDHMASESVGM